jgi:predicted site-specific integrase-resolvase|tara:strand:+ start:187 stop:315 length:129 start_codon:yes stop_codon:yes gene_type:complete
MDDDFVQELFDDMMNKVVELQADIYEMRQLQSQIAKKYVAMA